MEVFAPERRPVGQSARRTEARRQQDDEFFRCYGEVRLADIASMTVFILDVRHGDRFVEIRRDCFPDEVPASALITVTGSPIPT